MNEGGGAGIEICLSSFAKAGDVSKPDCATVSKFVNKWCSKEDYCRGHIINNPNKVCNVDRIFDDDTWFCPVCGDEGNDGELCHECGEVEYLTGTAPVMGFCPRCGGKTGVGMIYVKCPKHHKTGHWSYGRSFKSDGDITGEVGSEENPDLPPDNKYKKSSYTSTTSTASNLKCPCNSDDESSKTKKHSTGETGFIFIDRNGNNKFDEDESVIDLTTIKDSDIDDMSISMSSDDSDNSSIQTQCKTMDVSKAFQQVSVGAMKMHLSKPSLPIKARHSCYDCFPCERTGHPGHCTTWLDDIIEKIENDSVSKALNWRPSTPHYNSCNKYDVHAKNSGYKKVD